MIIVSIGLIKARLPNAKKIALNLMSGSIKPDKIIFCVSEEPYMLDDGFKKEELLGKGLKFCQRCAFKWVDNEGPIRRIAPVIEEFWDKPDTKIITIDDDRRPSRNLIKDLVNYSDKHPNVAISTAGNMLHTEHEKEKWKKFGVIYDARHHKNVGIVLGWGIRKPIDVDILNPGVGMLVKPKFFKKDFILWKDFYSGDLGINKTDQTFISYSLMKNGIKRTVIKSEYQGEYPSHGKRLCGESGLPFHCLGYKRKQLNLFFRTNFDKDYIL